MLKVETIFKQINTQVKAENIIYHRFREIMFCRDTRRRKGSSKKYMGETILYGPGQK